ncbi:MAG: hypothetical protein MZV64_73095 [Ignavibacteriales bacterium]|nr:hypothetical protein [Ignavibacteriales bacterium]
MRFIGNRSSGRMGFAVAARGGAARRARSRSCAGPTAVEPPPDAELVRVRSAAEMHDAVMAARSTPRTSSSWRPRWPTTRRRRRTTGKMAKSDERPDADAAQDARHPGRASARGARRAAARRPVLVGFAAETDDAVSKGRQKLASKQADFVAVNNVLEPGAGFDVETNVVTLVGPDWEEALPLQPKSSVAAAILDRAERLLGQPGRGPGVTGAR